MPLQRNVFKRTRSASFLNTNQRSSYLMNQRSKSQRTSFRNDYNNKDESQSQSPPSFRNNNNLIDQTQTYNRNSRSNQWGYNNEDNVNNNNNYNRNSAYYNNRNSQSQYDHNRHRYSDNYNNSRYQRYFRPQYNDNNNNNMYNNDGNDDVSSYNRHYDQRSRSNVFQRKKPSTELKWRKSVNVEQKTESQQQQQEKQKNEQQNETENKLNTKYDIKLTEIKHELTDLFQLVSKLKLNKRDDDDDDDEDEDEETDELPAINPNIDFVSNNTVVLHDDDLKETEEDQKDLQQTDEQRRESSHHRRSMPQKQKRKTIEMPSNLGHHKNASQTLLAFQEQYKSADTIKKNLIIHLKSLLKEVEDDLLPSFDDDTSSSASSDDDADNKAEHDTDSDSNSDDENKLKLNAVNDSNEIEEELRLGSLLQQLRISCSTWLKLPSSRMQQSGVSDGILLMKNLFDAFVRTDILNGEHKLLYNQIFSRVIKHLPYNSAGLTPLVSPLSSITSPMTIDSDFASATPSNNIVAAAVAANADNVRPGLATRQFDKSGNITRTPYNTPAMSRESSTNDTVSSTKSVVSNGGKPHFIGMGSDHDSVRIVEEDFTAQRVINEDMDDDDADDMKIHKKRHRNRRHNRTKSSIEEVMIDCDDNLRAEWNNMLGSVGNIDENLKETLKNLLIEVANNYANDDDIDDDKKNDNNDNKKRSSLKLKAVNDSFVENIIKIESDEEIMNKYWKNLNWDFDAIEFAKHPKVNGNCVVLLGYHLIKKHKFDTEFGLSVSKIIKFLYQIQEGYQDNPYHNKYHAADVMNNIYWFITQCSSIKKYFTSFDLLISILSAAIHDVDHNGKNNQYHQRTKSKLALTYNDQSILENHHIAYAFKLMKFEKECDWMSDFKEEELINRARSYMIRLVLSTDMSRHKKHEKHCDQLIKIVNSNSDANDALDEETKLTILSIVLHACDIANAAKINNLCKEWAIRCIEEFRIQGDAEKKFYGKESQPLFKRDHPLEKSQQGWIQFVMLPYFKQLNKVIPETNILTNHLNDNLQKWKKYKEYQ